MVSEKSLESEDGQRMMNDDGQEARPRVCVCVRGGGGGHSISKVVGAPLGAGDPYSFPDML